MTKHYTTSGTLGDAYLTSLLFYNQVEPIILHHWVRGEHKYWWPNIEYLLKLAPAVKQVIFDEELDSRFPQVKGAPNKENPKELKITWYPDYNFSTEYKNYAVVCVNSGKPYGRGKNTKCLTKELLESCLNDCDYITEDLIILLGTDDRYKDIKHSKCLNLVGSTTLKKALGIASGAKEFFGPEGLLLFVSLSHRVRSTALYTSQQAMDVRVVGTPWEKHLTLVKQNYGYGLTK